MRTRLGGLGLVLLLALVTAACGSEAEPSTKPAPSSSPSPSTPPGVDTTVPKPPGKPADTLESAAEFARYFVQVAQYATRTRDVTPLVVLARDQATCTSCRQLSTYIEGLKEDELWETGEDLELVRLRVRSKGDSTYTVSGPVTYPRIGFVDAKGDEQAEQDASTYSFSVDLVWDQQRDRWGIRDYTLTKKGRK